MDICPSDSILIETYFDEGSLGVSLKFRSNEGIGFISAIIPNSQAINKNVQQDDELWAVGSQIIGLNRLEKPDWNRLIDFIPKSIRPLRMVWRRRRDMMTALDYENEAKSTGTAKRRPSGTQQNSFPSSLAVPQRRPSTEAPSPGKPRSRSSSPTPLNFSNLQSRNFSAGGGGGSNTSSGKSIILTPKTVEQLEADHRAKAGEVIKETQTQQLTDMASRLVLSGNVKSANLNNQSPNEFFVSRQRQFLFSAQLMVEVKDSFWNSLFAGNQFQKKQVILLTDMLLITSPLPVTTLMSNPLQLDNMIDLITMKLSKQDTPAAYHASPLMQSQPGSVSGGQQRRYSASGEPDITFLSFDVIWPSGQLKVISKSTDQRDALFSAILKACCARSGFDPLYHITSISPTANQSTAGTSSADTSNPTVSASTTAQPRSRANSNEAQVLSIHDAVIAQNESRLKYFLSLVQSKQLDIDDTDDSGYTALHYACILHRHKMIQLLYDAGANIIFNDSNGYTPLHWSAVLLDSEAINIMLTEIIDPDVNDHSDRSPLHLACVESKFTSDNDERERLRTTISSLLSRRADPNSHDIENTYILHHVAAMWKHEVVRVLSKESFNIHATCGDDFLGSALHYACQAVVISDELLSLPVMINAIKSDSLTRFQVSVRDSLPSDFKRHSRNPQDGIRVLRELLEAGCRPNYRNSAGKTPLQVLSERMTVWRQIRLAVCTLIEFGARISPDYIEPSALTALKNKIKSESTGDDSSGSPKKKKGGEGEGESSERDLNDDTEDQVGYDKNMTIEKALDKWSSHGDVYGDSLGLRSSALKPEDDSAFTCYPIDGKEKCVLCSSTFSLFKFAYKCKLCEATSCDDCSKKRVVLNKKKERVCDSCYNVAVARHKVHHSPKSVLTLETTRERGYTGSTNNTADGSAGTPASAAARSKANLISSSTAPSTGDKKKSKPISENIRDDVDSPASEDSEPEPDSSDEEEGCDKKPVKPPRVAVQRKSLDSKAARRISDEEIKVPKHKERPKSMAFSALTGGLVAAPSSSTAVATKNEQASRLSLFGTSTAKTDKEAETRVNGTINTMNEINERLKQRGERLTRLQDRTEDLANNAGEFAKMAKQLKEQQKKSSGWF